MQKRKADNDLPRPTKESSTERYKSRGLFINTFSVIIPRAYSNYRRANREYKVYVRSGVYGKCYLRSGTYDIRII